MIHLFLMATWLLTASGEAVTPAPQAVQPGGIVTAVGKGIIVKEDRAKARNDALSDALKNAVEQVVGTFMTHKSVEEHFELLDSRIYDRSSEYVRTYRILDEKEEGDLYTIQIEAQVGSGEIEKDLASLGLLATGRQAIKVVVFVMEQNTTDSSPRSFLYRSTAIPGSLPTGSLPVAFSPGLPTASEAVLTERFKDEGMTVVDPLLVTKRVGEERALKQTSLDDSVAGDIAKISGADLAVYGRAVARIAPGTVSGMVTSQADVFLRAVKAGSGKVLATSTGRGIGVHSDEASAGTEALKKGTGEAAQDLAGKILAAWGGAEGELRTIQVTATGVTRFALLHRLEDVLEKEIKGIKSVSLRSLSAGKALLDVEYPGSAKALTADLSKEDLGGIEVTCEERSP